MLVPMYDVMNLNLKNFLGFEAEIVEKTEAKNCFVIQYHFSLMKPLDFNNMKYVRYENARNNQEIELNGKIR